MFTHILLPTDGSPLSEVAIQQGIKFAKDANAKITGFHVTPQFHVFTYKTEDLEGGAGTIRYQAYRYRPPTLRTASVVPETLFDFGKS